MHLNRREQRKQRYGGRPGRRSAFLCEDLDESNSPAKIQKRSPLKSLFSLIPPVPLFLAALLIGCRPPGKPTTADIELKPQEVRDFATLYQQNCAGCHGQDGKGSPALALANPVYWSIATDDTIRRVIATGVHGSLMPAFAKSSGGTLTDQQIEILVREMRTLWAKVKAPDAPPYAETEPGDAVHGVVAYATFCGGCHGPEGKGTKKGSSIVDDSFLALVSDQDLRTTIIAGRPDLGHPDWRSYVANRPMTSQEVTDVVAWLAAQRKVNPGQPYPSNEVVQTKN
jgi:cytochrome c oxidase cbb3-type subunit 3/ubiquinol-cytochrome c reductase cytochrome c subunit